MSGVWVFDKNGVMRLVEKSACGSSGRRKVLVYVPTDEVIESYDMLTEKLREVGWVRRPRGNPNLLQFEKDQRHLITLPSDFRDFILMHMYDIVVQTRNVFVVRDLLAAPPSSSS